MVVCSGLRSPRDWVSRRHVRRIRLERTDAASMTSMRDVRRPLADTPTGAILVCHRDKTLPERHGLGRLVSVTAGRIAGDSAVSGRRSCPGQVGVETFR